GEWIVGSRRAATGVPTAGGCAAPGTAPAEPHRSTAPVGQVLPLCRAPEEMRLPAETGSHPEQNGHRLSGRKTAGRLCPPVRDERTFDPECERGSGAFVHHPLEEYTRMSEPQPIVRPQAGGKHLRIFGGVEFTVQVTSEESGGAFTLLDN